MVLMNPGWDPWRELRDFALGLDRHRRHRPPVNVYESGDSYGLEIEVPGMEEKDLEISLFEGRLTVSGEKKSEQEEEDKSYRLVERSHGHFSRSVDLPGDVDAENVQASCKNGVLSVRIPRSEKAKPRKIEIK